MADFLQIIFELETFANYTPVAGGSTLFVDLKLDWNIGITYDGDSRWVLPALPPDVPITAPKTQDTAEYVPTEMLGITPGATTSPDPTSAPDADCGLWLFNYGHQYFRIWVVPDYLNPQNPGLLTDIPFIIWSAWTIDNVLNSIGGTGQTGLTLDITTPLSFSPVEEKTVNLQITSSAPVIIYAEYIFSFDYGTGYLIFETIVLEWIKYIPEQPVNEEWSWLTDIISAHDGTEQRISCRRQPRRRIEENFLIEGDEKRAIEYRRWYSRLPMDLVIPFYQYATRVTADSVITDTKIYFDPDKTDVRDEEIVVIFRPSTEDSYLLKLDTVQSDGATLDTPLTVDIYAGDIIAPAFTCRIDNDSGPSMTTVSGTLVLGAEVEDFRSSFDRPGSTAVIDEFDSLMVLDRCPLANSSVPEAFDTNPTIVDNQTGLHEQRVSWLHPYIAGARSFSVKRVSDPGEMDFWRDFLTALVGMREPFLMPTWRGDLVLATTPLPGDPTIEIEGSFYTDQYFPYDTYQRLRFVNPDGDVIYRKVTDSESLPGGTTQLTLDSSVPIDAEWGNGFTIGYLNRVRLGSDSVRWKHFGTYSIVDLVIRSTDQ